MEPDELKTAWQALGQQLERHQHIQWQLLKDSKLDRVRRGLRPLYWGQALQMLLGIGLVVLGIACWSRNVQVPGLFANGILVHAFGVVTLAMAGITMGLISRIDYAAPVLRIQKQFALLRRFYRLNAYLCGATWWIMWLPVTVAFAGLDRHDPAVDTPAWVAWSLGISAGGLLATCFFAYWQDRRQRATGRPGAIDESDGIRRGRQLLDEVASFERE